ncbi:hypothetical protein H2200_000296 [Cladophialophora chaetospira]|uniref:BTB domain-containing protein n=1 Tax=Cladophialophora chaetospira TaxID=386627 RepID=A0AA38XNA5_9EURO|nr:hypothetical protein H2200_000296 [Cladophialophora chaetospira]
MQSEHELTPGWFAESPTVVVRVKEPHGEHRNFYLHKSILDYQNGHLHWLPQGNDPSMPALMLQFSISTFRDFVSWMYGGKFNEATTVDQVHGLWLLSRKYHMAGLSNALIDWCRDHCRTERPLLHLLRILASSTADPQDQLSDYVVEKVAHDITTKGWVKVIEASNGEWERFMNTHDTPSCKKGKYLSAIMSKLENAEKMDTNGELADPATSVCKWHHHGAGDEATGCGTKEACKACNHADFIVLGFDDD